jgi:signal transduction histidine kinase
VNWPMRIFPQRHVERDRGPWAFLLRLVARRATTLFLLFLVLSVEVLFGTFVVRDLFITQGQLQQIYLRSIQGLRGIGEVQYQAQEARRSTLYALTTNDGNLQVKYADQSRAADRRVSDGITQYLRFARMPREAELGNRLANDWEAYLQVRDEVLGLILEGSIAEAVALDLTSGVPFFDRVRQDLEKIKGLYDEQASQQLLMVNAVSRRTILRLIGAFGFALLFGAGSVWAIQRNKMRGEIQLAKQQMDFVAAVSHELRTPVTSILCAGENIRDGFAEGRGNMAEQVSILVDQAAQLAGLVEQVVLFAATDTKPSYPLQPLQVPEILASALRNTSVLLQGSSFTVEQQTQEGLPPVLGDLSAVSQCLQNLIANAVKYSPEQRTITLSAQIGHAAASKKEVQISVQDHGWGISSTDLPRIFEPFFRSPDVVAAQIHGTGLGLSIAKNMIEAAGGRLSVVSEVGIGSTFTLHLPVADGDTLAETVTSTPDPRRLAT